MNNLHPEYSKEKILKNVKYTAIGAAIIFVTIVLPAEYGKDPTGFGRLTGLIKLAPDYKVETEDLDMSSSGNDELEEIDATKATGQELKVQDKDNEESYEYQELEKTYTLKAGKDTEVKFKMYKGSEMNFDWESSETVYFDQHGEPTTKEGKEFLPYKTVKEGKQGKDTGILKAEFTGTHGWYWRNLSNDDITIKLSLKGNFK